MAIKILTDFKKFKGFQLKWKKIYTLMHHIQTKLALFLNQKIQSKNTSLKTKII